MLKHLQKLGDKDLARLVRAGSLEAFDVLLRRYETRVFNYVRSRIARTEDAEDLTQAIFVKAYRNIGRYDPHRKFETWIFCIARRETISHYRRARDLLRRAMPIEADDCIAEPSSSESGNSMEGIWTIARGMLSALEFDSLWMHYREDMSIAEVASALGRSQGASKATLHRARAKLLKFLSARNAHELGSGIEWRIKDELLTM